MVLHRVSTLRPRPFTLIVLAALLVALIGTPQRASADPASAAPASAAPPTTPAESSLLARILAGYRTTFEAQGVRQDDWIHERLSARGLPPALFEAPDEDPIEAGQVIDALSTQRHGYRAISLAVRTRAGRHYQRTYTDDHRRLTPWSPVPPGDSAFTASMKSLGAMQPVGIRELLIPGRPRIIDLPGPVLDQTYDSLVPTNPFAGYIGMVTLIEAGTITRQWPTAWFDLADSRASVGSVRPMVMGRVTLAIAGHSLDEIQRQIALRDLERQVAAGNAEIIGREIRDRATAEQPFSDRWTPLMLAAARGQAPMVKALLGLGADANQAVTGLPSPLELAVHFRHQSAALLLLDGGARLPTPLPGTGDYTVVAKAASNGQLELVRRLLDAGADPNDPVGSGITTLIATAAANRNPQREATLRLLLKSGADPQRLDRRCASALDFLKRTDAALAVRMQTELAVPATAVERCRRESAAAQPAPR